jgi:DNA polymerase-3 subunit gamma/tau
LVDAIIERNHAHGLEIVQAAQDAGSDPRQFARQVVDYLRAILLAKAEGTDRADVPPEAKLQVKKQSEQIDNSRLLACIRFFSSAAGETPRGGTWQPGLQLELAVVQSMDTASFPAGNGSHSTPMIQTLNTEKRKLPVADKISQEKDVQISNVNNQAAIPVQEQLETPSEKNPPSDTNTPMSLITQRWVAVKDLVKSRRIPTAGLLNSSTPMIKGNILVLGFQGEVVRSKMDTPENLELTRQAIREVCGMDVDIRCIVNTRSGSAVPIDEDIESDGLVGTALGQGGQIVHKD